MEFILNGRTHVLEAETVRRLVPRVTPEPIKTHWVEIEGELWPPKQAFRVATGLAQEPFISHMALRIFRKLGFRTSDLPSPLVTQDVPRTDIGRTPADALAAFAHLDEAIGEGTLTERISYLERELDGAGSDQAAQVLAASAFDDDLVDSALIVRERIGMMDSLIHAAVITQVLPKILEPGETLVKRPSLGAGNDAERPYDLETNFRVAEFKLSSWKGSDGMRQRGLFADVVGLSLDTSGRRREMYVVGELPVRFLATSKRSALKTLSKSALKLRAPEGLSEAVSVAEFTSSAAVDVIDLTTLFPKLR